MSQIELYKYINRMFYSNILVIDVPSLTHVRYIYFCTQSFCHHSLSIWLKSDPRSAHHFNNEKEERIEDLILIRLYSLSLSFYIFTESFVQSTRVHRSWMKFSTKIFYTDSKYWIIPSILLLTRNCILIPTPPTRSKSFSHILHICC
jgi:hypothetical protein